jgi:hypothetical protein
LRGKGRFGGDVESFDAVDGGRNNPSHCLTIVDFFNQDRSPTDTEKRREKDAIAAEPLVCCECGNGSELLGLSTASVASKPGPTRTQVAEFNVLVDKHDPNWCRFNVPLTSCKLHVRFIFHAQRKWGK